MPSAFVEPPDGPIDLEKAVAAVPPGATIKGVFLGALLGEAKRRNLVLAGARDRYVPFQSYPLVEHMRLLVEGARKFFPDATTRVGLRKLGRAAHTAFLESTVGRVIWAGAQDMHGAIGALVKGYPVMTSSTRVLVTELAPEHAIVRLEHVPCFLDSHQVGVFEGFFRALGVRGHVLVRLESHHAADFRLEWASEAGKTSESTSGKAEARLGPPSRRS
ncbi:MAG: hypothetical protein NVSMB47_13250 [Polyangiales bacterium]